MQIHVSPEDGLPVYQQIFNQIRYLAASNVLTPCEELPPIRSLAEQRILRQRIDTLLADAKQMGVSIEEPLPLEQRLRHKAACRALKSAH